MGGISIVRCSSPGLIRRAKVPGHLSDSSVIGLNRSRTVSSNCSPRAETTPLKAFHVTSGQLGYGIDSLGFTQSGDFFPSL